MIRILSTARTEFRIALRNRWVAIALVLMAVFSLVLALAGPAPVLDWLRGTTLLPYLAPLDEAGQAAFLDELGPRLAAAYPANPADERKRA